MKVVALVIGILAAGTPIGGYALAAGHVLPDSIAFGPVRLGTPAVDTVRVVNPGLIDLLVDSLRVLGDDFDLPAEAFTGSSVWLDPSDTLRVPVRYTPSDTGSTSANLYVSFPSGHTRVPLIGEGVREVVVINEVLADPPPGDAGDANGDGTRNSYGDEFVELLNIGLRPFDLSGCQLSDSGAKPDKRFTFPPSTRIGPGERVVLFGGGTPSGFPGQVFVDDGRIGGGLSNGGDGVYLIDPAGPDTLACAAFGPEAGSDESLVRQPEGRGALVRHGLPPGEGAAMSPGGPRAVLTGIRVVPTADSLSLDETVTFSVTGVYSDSDTAALTDDLVWSVEDTTTLRIKDRIGHARGVGSVGVVVLLGELRSSEIRITVLPPPLRSLRLVPQDTTVLLGDDVSYRAIGVYLDESEVQIDGGLVWSCSDTTVAMVAEGSRLQTISAGSTTVSASLEGLVAEGLLRSARGGDLNADAVHDVLDAVRLVHLILGFEGTGFERRAADLNLDGTIDIVDLAWLIRTILGNPVAETKPAPVLAGRWWDEGDVLRVATSAPLRALSFAISGRAVEVLPPPQRGWSICTEETQEGLVRAIVYSLEPSGLHQDLRIQVGRDGEAGKGGAGESGLSSRISEVEGVGHLGHRVALRQDEAPPAAFALHRIRPNPFNATAVLSYDLPSAARVLLRVFSPLGQEIGRLVDGPVEAGRHRVGWDGTDRSGRPAASGVYLACLEASGLRAVVPMVLVK